MASEATYCILEVPVVSFFTLEVSQANYFLLEVSVASYSTQGHLRPPTLASVASYITLGAEASYSTIVQVVHSRGLFAQLLYSKGLSGQLPHSRPNTLL